MSRRGFYKGRPFRSLYEYSFYKHLEGLGVDIGDIAYEAVALPYVMRGRTRRYFPDFLIPTLGELVEVKSTWELGKRRGCRIREAKFAAGRAYCESHGLRFVVVTERDFRTVGLAEARRDPHVRLSRNVGRPGRG